jgi:hypothetical protein
MTRSDGNMDTGPVFNARLFEVMPDHSFPHDFRLNGQAIHPPSRISNRLLSGPPDHPRQLVSRSFMTVLLEHCDRKFAHHEPHVMIDELRQACELP